MQIDKEIRERLRVYQVVTQQTQKEAVNDAICEMLDRAESNPAMKQRMEYVANLRAELLSM